MCKSEIDVTELHFPQQYIPVHNALHTAIVRVLTYCVYIYHNCLRWTKRCKSLIYRHLKKQPYKTNRKHTVQRPIMNSLARI